MRILITFSLYLLSMSLYGAALNPLVGCLGQEELRLHKAKRTGPVYKLNQLFLNDMISAGDITLKEEAFKRVCINPTFTPSVDLMREILLQGSQIFMLARKRTQNIGIRNFQLATIEEIKRLIPHIFFSYISDLQSRTATSDCLTKYIPELKYFQERFKYLESEVGGASLISEPSKIKKIFKSLKNLQEIKKKCSKDKIKREKKKAKS